MFLESSRGKRRAQAWVKDPTLFRPLAQQVQTLGPPSVLNHSVASTVVNSSGSADSECGCRVVPARLRTFIELIAFGLLFLRVAASAALTEQRAIPKYFRTLLAVVVTTLPRFTRTVG
jgi:hypothetical protein